MRPDVQTQQADEWWLALHVPASLPAETADALRASVQEHLARCVERLALPPGCRLELSEEVPRDR